ncbi:penicillin-binding protein 1C [Spirochaeta cellobiosiphila]|uniref:penicillin-binding protein 1C n=1 Tax=Spirochaeta cellobiosiphila TaxID=504483 RepID=UPI0003F7F334|nr:penicillin-binding protein 1C [Spirochaeta cellobiosiphila]
MIDFRKIKDRIVRYPVFWFLSFSLLVFYFILPRPLFKDDYSTVLLDKNDQLLSAQLAKDGQWRFPPVKKLPYKYKTALLNFEDHHFYYHPGIDPMAVVRATIQNIQEGSVVSGASTITMQVARLSYGNQKRTILQKIKEMFIALRIECSYSKDEILILFASHAPYGGNIVGLDTAAWRYFNRSADNLSWAESALLAVLPNSPSLLHLGKNRSFLKDKRDRLLQNLYKNRYINEETLNLSIIEPLPQKPHEIAQEGYHLMMTHNKHHQNSKSLISTTIDLNLQRKIGDVLIRHYNKWEGNGIHNMAALIIDVPTGKVLAYEGNLPINFNGGSAKHVDIIQARRSTGSLLKPFLYASMLDDGMILPDSLIADIPTFMGGYRPENYNQDYMGAVKASVALASSLNVPTARMLRDYGIDRFYNQLKRFGMTTLDRPVDSYGITLILGGAESTLWNLTSLYASLGRSVLRENRDTEYTFFSPHYIKGEQSTNVHKAPVSKGVISLTLDTLLSVNRPNEEGAWQEFSSGRAVSWKTGTSYGYRDAWAIGITPQYAVGVWVGNANGEGRPKLTGSLAAAPLLFDIFSYLPVTNSFEPNHTGLVQSEVCVQSGYLPGPYCDDTIMRWIPEKGLSSQVCPFHKELHLDSNEEYQVTTEIMDVDDIVTKHWFVLPPTMAWYYQKRNFDYIPPPPFKEGISQNQSLSILSPSTNSQIYLPIDFNGQSQSMIMEAHTAIPHSTLYWHLDDQLIGITTDSHKLEYKPNTGQHKLTVLDKWGNENSIRFEVLSK